MKLRGPLGLVLAIVVCQGAGILGALFTAPSIPNWYASLQRPSFTPPSWLFAPAWITLYTLMGIAVYLVFRQGWEKPAIRSAVYLFGVQLVLNAIWSWLFFGLHRIDLALAEIVVLFFAILVTMVLFFQLSRLAGCLLIPYLAWVGFASVLTFQYWRLN